MGRRRKRTLYRKHCMKPTETEEQAYAKLERLLAQGATRLEVYPCRRHAAPCYHVGHMKGSLTKL
jgi:hypothetical protein